VIADLSFLLDPTTIFSYGMEQRLQCSDCKKVRYRVDAMDVVSVAVPAHEKGKDADGKVIYAEVQLTQCLETLLGSEALEYGCPHCQKSVHAIKWVLSYIIQIFSDSFLVYRQTKFASFPQVLVIHAKKFQLVNWVPAKLGKYYFLLLRLDLP
jgi:ubiquitin carboxyl-terminal hydrolase 5/13